MTRVCRDCLQDPGSGHDCQHCRSGRITDHPELTELTIAHMDCDAFYASVEKRDNPELAKKPLIVGHGQRGVVTTACYLARMSGVGSAMPIYRARRLCPDAVFIPPDMKKYKAVSRQIRALMDEVTPLVEPLSLDEAFLDLAGTERLLGHPPAITMMNLANRIEREIGISVSVGLAPNKYLAKLASDMEKPRGFTVIGRGDALQRLAELPITRIWGVGKVAARKLERDGLTMINQLQEMEESSLIRRYGELGQRLYHLSRGQDTRRVKTGRPSKSISAERTLAKDIHDLTELEQLLWPLCERVSRELKEAELAGRTITLKMKDNLHRTRTRSTTLPDPTRLADRIFECGQKQLSGICDGTRWRLIGIGVSGLTGREEADPLDILEPGRNKRASAELAMDNLRQRFGGTSVQKGRSLSGKAKSADRQK